MVLSKQQLCPSRGGLFGWRGSITGTSTALTAGLGSAGAKSPVARQQPQLDSTASCSAPKLELSFRLLLLPRAITALTCSAEIP